MQENAAGVSMASPRRRTAVRRLCGAAAVSAALLLAACGGAGTPPEPAAAGVGIAFDLPDFDRTATRRTLNRDPWTGNEVRYAEFSGDDAFAAVVLVTAAPGYVLEPRDLTGHFARMLPGAEIIWAEQGGVRAAGGRSLRYRMFRLPETAFGCVAFDGWWRPAPEDGQVLRFTRQTFGFYCRAAGRALGEPEARRIIRRVRFHEGG